MAFGPRIMCFWVACLAAAMVGATDVPERASRHVPGVAFDLTMDYGVAAIHFHNGTSVPLARVEGNVAYKAFMRKPGGTVDVVEEQPELPLYWKPVCWLLDRFEYKTCDWELSGPNAEDHQAVGALVEKLQRSADTFLETSFCFVGVTVPDNTQNYQSHVVSEAVKAARLVQTHRVFNASRIVASDQAMRNLEDELDERVQPVLFIDYSNSGLRAAVYAEESGLSDMIRADFNPELGARFQHSQGHREDIGRFLTELLKPPFGHDAWDSPISDELRYIVAYGDAATRSAIVDITKDVLTDPSTRLVVNDPSEAVPALAMAKVSQDRLMDLDFDAEPFQGCRRKSRLYDRVHWEL